MSGDCIGENFERSCLGEGIPGELCGGGISERGMSIGDLSGLKNVWEGLRNVRGR